MHELALEQRRDLGVRAPWHVGDVTWGLRQHEGREDEWTIRVWKDGDRTVAWSWLKGDRGLLEFDVRRDRLDLLDEILADPDARTAVAFEDDAEVRAALLRNGFTPDGEAPLTRQGAVMHFLARDLPERARAAGAAGGLPLPDGRARRPRRARRRPPRRLGAVPRHRVELRERPGLVAVPRLPRLRRRGARRPLRRLLPALAGRREPSRRARAGRRARGVQAARPRRRRLHVRAPPLARGGRPAGDRLLRERRGVRALRVDRLPPPRDARRLLALTLLVQEACPSPPRAGARRTR